MLPMDFRVAEHLIMVFPLIKANTPALALEQDPLARVAWETASMEERNMATRLWLVCRAARFYCRAKYLPLPNPEVLPAARILGMPPKSPQEPSLTDLD